MPASTSAVCQPLSDSTTYIYSDLDNGFTPPTSCLGRSFTSVPDGYDRYASSTAGTKTKTYISLDVYRGRDPACFPPRFPAACSYTATFTQVAGQLYGDIPALPQSSIEVTGVTWSETHYVYSPATCPEHYATMSIRTDATAGNVTSAICCPISAVLQNTTMIFSSSVMNLFAPTIKVAWHKSDMIRWRDAPATSTPTVLVPSSTSNADTEDSRPSSNMAIIAATAVGSIAAVAIVAAIALLFWRRRTKWSRLPKNDDSSAHKVELSGEGKNHAELSDDMGLHESEAQDRPKEVAEQRAPAELDSGWNGWEAPALLDLDFSNFGTDQDVVENSPATSDCGSSVQQTPVELIARR
ncbi:uncharacterized protein M421DRAFT_399172 [Didymella exigua CBS 183.55]|uniref:Mid2 domain-containing protein n=1 Tax=Didymella exigua CBS 183.55 TaxID=1150837 RepID=A0A6A5RWF9_9PLEO|nr:uncharacterized protein M421DRAFT_399172 [Didymella exigua CBS 183.55]KAF1932751.1 hypothetical protein M421DRAFT_399172 [Didymella exigua CBS 183.55]